MTEMPGTPQPLSQSRFFITVPIAVGVLVVALCVVFFWQLTAFDRSIRHETLAGIREETELLRQILTPKLSAGDFAGAKAFCEGFHRDSLRLTLIREDGTVVADSVEPAVVLENHLQREEIRDALAGTPTAVTRHSASTGLWMTYYATVIDGLPDGERFLLRTAVSTDRTESITRIVRKLFWLSMALGATVVLLLTWYLLQRVRKPLRALQQSMERIAGGDFEAEIPVPEKGAVRPVAENVRKMTERLKSQLHELQRLENFRRDFLANVTHEIKTPLTAIIGSAETLQEAGEELPTEQRARLVEMMCMQARRLDSLVQDILALSSLEHGQEEQRGEFYRFPLADAVQSAVEECRPFANRQEIQLFFEAHEQVDVVGDPQLLSQAVSNLVNNALKYSGSKSVTVTLSRIGQNAVISCIDHGCGIPRCHWPRIFERFYRVSKERSRSLGGTGLGLAIVKHVMQLHNGTAEIDETPGNGATFRLTLPAAEDTPIFV